MLFKKTPSAGSDPSPAKRSWFKKPESGADITDVEVREPSLSPEPVDQASLQAAPRVSGASPARDKSRKSVKDDGARPIKLLMGYLADTSERDTYYYMLGMAERNLDSESIGYAGLFPFENGYVYEIHEGGAGRSFAESIIAHFNSLPPYVADEDQYVYVRTTTRAVRIERVKQGLYSVILPEGEAPEESAFVKPGKKLAPLVEKRTALLLVGVALFLSGLIALAGSYITRYQPYTPGQLNLDRVAAKDLPYAQWCMVMDVPPDDYVTELRFDGHKWLVKTAKQKTITQCAGKAGHPGIAKPETGGSSHAKAVPGPAAAKEAPPATPVPALPAAPH